MRQQQQTTTLYHHHNHHHGSRFQEKITRIGRRIIRLNIRWSVVIQKISVCREILRLFWDRFLACSIGKQVRYRRLSSSPVEVEHGFDLEDQIGNGYETDSDLVTLKISLLGDCQIGKTSFMVSFAFLLFCFQLLNIYIFLFGFLKDFECEELIKKVNICFIGIIFD